MQPKGSLAETDLRSLLEGAQSERATGTLTVHDGDQACTLYFLFGHLFHAMANGSSGDDAVVEALKWPAGDYAFDAKAKLPPDETVRSTIPELIQAADQNSPASEPVEEAQPEPIMVTARSESESTQQPEPVGWHTVEPESDPTPSFQTQEATPAPEPPSNQNHEPFSWPSVEAPQPRRSIKQKPAAKHGREPVPVPAGSVMYDALKTSFVDFPRLITTLEKEGYTGYVRLLTDTSSGLIFFRDGSALECVYDQDGNVIQGKEALSAFNQQVAQGQGALDVVNLNPDLINGLYELTVATPVYTELYASWVDMPALLNFLEERKLTGSVTVRAEQATGVIILTNGDLTGAYTTESRDVARDVNGVLSLCSDGEAMIEVKASTEPGSPGRLDVDDIVGRRSGGSTPATAPAAPPPAPPMQAAPQSAPPPAPPVQSGNSNPTPPLEETSPLRFNNSQGTAPPTSFNDVQPAPAAEPAPQAPPEQAFEAAPAAQTFRTSGGAPDWDQVIADLQAMADESLGNRSRKVKDVLGSADRSQEGVMEAINQVPTISILFIDRSRLESLADEMRARVQSYL